MTQHRSMMAVATLALLFGGCAMPPVAADPVELSHAPYAPLVNGRTVTVEVVCVNGRTPPGRSMEDAVAILARHVAGEVRTVQGPPVTIETGLNPLPAQDQLDEVIERRTYRGPSDITVYVTPGLMGMDNRGYCRRMPDGSHVVVLAGDRVDQRAGLFRETGWKVIAAHELCHALDIPADCSHAWHGQHCTHPECLLYPTVDWRSALTALMRLGPPTELCLVCRQEIRCCQEAARGRLMEPSQPFDDAAGMASLEELPRTEAPSPAPPAGTTMFP